MKSLESQDSQTILKFEKIAPEIYVKLQGLKRTGWVRDGVENPESVKEHTESLVKLAIELSESLTDEEKHGLVEMLEVHDWPEALLGDEVILELDPEARKVLKDVKYENEKKALAEICKDLPNGDEIMALWLRYEKSTDPAAVFGRQLDKYQVIEKALEYELSQGILLFENFLNYSVNFIEHPVLLQKVEQLKSKWKE